jgi:hypothetical protein
LLWRIELGRKLTLVGDTPDEELGAIGLVEELGALDYDGVDLGDDGGREERGACQQAEASHCEISLQAAEDILLISVSEDPDGARCGGWWFVVLCQREDAPEEVAMQGD